MTPLRPLAKADITPLARIWHAGWHSAHAAHVPAALTALRTEADFADRLARLGDCIRVAGPTGAPHGFCAARDDEIYQMFVDPGAQGSGLAGQLLSDGEARIRAGGHRAAWLWCIPQNARALAFYRRQGWQVDGPTRAALETSAGAYWVDLLKLSKALSAQQPAQPS